jgi:hypothetical protein
VVYVNKWESLGVLANSGKVQEFKQIRARANEEINKLR